MSTQKDAPDRSDAIAHQDRDGASVQALMLYRISRSTGWMAFFALIIVIGGAVSGYMFWKQLAVMQEQLDEMQELSEKIQQGFDAGTTQAAALSKAVQALSEQITRGNEAKDGPAVAAQIEVAGSKASHVALDRPWVGVESVSAGSLQPNRNFIINAHLRNGGRGPAINVRAVFNTATPAVKDIAMSDIEPCATCTQSVLLPNASMSHEVAIDASALTATKINYIKNGDDAILLLGRIDYMDTLGNPHVTKVCMVYVPKLSGFSACSQGNRFD